MPIRVRLTLLAALGALVLTVAGGWVFLNQLGTGLHQSIDSSLRTRGDALVQTVHDAQGAIDFQDPGSTRLIDAREAIAQVVNAKGRLVESSEGAGRRILVPAEVLRAARDKVAYSEGRIPEDSHPARFLATSVSRPGGRWIVIVGRSLESVDDAMTRVRTGLVVGGSLTVLLAAAGAWILATFALRPVTRMRRQAAALSEHDAAGRLPIPGTHDEIAELGETMNALLARLQHSLAQQRAFVADASHELRTPLAILRTELELAGRPGRDADELRQAISDAGTETERLSNLAEQLLFLAKHDEPATIHSQELQPLRPLLDQAIEATRSQAADRGVDLSLAASPDIAVGALGEDLRRALDNLIANALRYAPQGTTVELFANDGGTEVTIGVRDRGPGFPPAFLPQAFERFRRADDARTRDDGGSGLGLAIVRAVARDHGGDADALNRRDGGAEVRMRLPSTGQSGRE